MIGNLLLLIPLVGALLLMLPNFKDNARKIALFFVGLEFLVSIAAWLLNRSSAHSLLNIDITWINAINAHWSLKVTGISLTLAILNAVLFPIIFASTDKNHSDSRFDYANRPLFYSLGLFMQMAMMGVFITRDAFSFYIFWELALIPIYFICLLWGAEGKEKITLKFFLYTFFGSVFMLAAFIYLYHHTALVTNGGYKSWNMQDFYKAGQLMTPAQQTVIFWMLFVAFAVKIPIIPFHSWQPDTYTNAPIQGTMMLSGLMLKMGLYGLLFWLVPIVPHALEEWKSIVMLLAIIAVVYASLIAFIQTDFKRLLAYSSMAHVGLISAGILSGTRQGMDGASVQMFAHGVYIVGLFYIVHLLEKHTGTRDIHNLGGIRNLNGQFSNLFLIILFGSIALPLTQGFVGEFLIVTGLSEISLKWAIIGGLSMIFGAVYMLRSYRSIMLGDVVKTNYTFGAMDKKDKFSLFFIAILVLLLGIYPQLLSAFAGQDILQLLSK